MPRREEYFEDNKVIVDRAAGGADMVKNDDHGLKAEGWASLALQTSVNNMSSGEEHMKLENQERKNLSESEGISEIEATGVLPDNDNISIVLQSPIFQSILKLISPCVNCTNNMFQFLYPDEEILYPDEETPDAGSGLAAESVKGPHDHNKNHWKLIRDACNSKKSGNDNHNNVSSLWNVLLESEIFMQKTHMGNTVLHMAAENGNEQFVDKIVRQAPHLLTAKSLNGDTALHVAAKSGHFHVLKKLIAAHFMKYSENHISGHNHEALEKILEKNNEGNTFFHEALINSNDDKGVMDFLVSHDDDNLKQVAKLAALSITSNENKSGVYLAIESGYKHVVDQALTQLIPKGPEYVPQGKSLLFAAILKQNEDILKTILTKKPEWIHLTDKEGRIPLHYAASIGYLEGVKYLLTICSSCVMETDKNGFFPIHLASYAGHVKIVQELLKSESCPDPRDILHADGRNILHLAAQSGVFNVVKYILQASGSDHGLEKMINEQDSNGNTPLHLATLWCHPKIVYAMTWNKKVDLSLVNKKGETALDISLYPEKPSVREQLTWIALKSACVHSVEQKSLTIKVPPKSTDQFSQRKGPDLEPYKDRIDTLLLVSTLIITATFATGFALPGGTDDQGMASMRHHIWFKIFIFCITTSMYGAISVTIILFWAQLGDTTLAVHALKVAKPLLGITLATLSLSFLAGVHLVIRDLILVDTFFLALGFLFIFGLLLLYTMLWFPSSTSKQLVRYISYYPFWLLASLVDHEN